MPLGVEHQTQIRDRTANPNVSQPLMPLGVEHELESTFQGIEKE